MHLRRASWVGALRSKVVDRCGVSPLNLDRPEDHALQLSLVHRHRECGPHSPEEFERGYDVRASCASLVTANKNYPLPHLRGFRTRLENRSRRSKPFLQVSSVGKHDLLNAF